VGVPLIDRSEFPVALTAQGVLFRDAAEAALRTLTDVRELLRGQAAASLGVTLVTGRSLALNFLPPWFERLKSRVPDLRARVLTTAMPDGTLMLVEGGVDFLLSYWNEGIPLLLDGGEFEYLSVGRECLLPVSVPLAGGAPRHALPGLAGAPVHWLRVAENTRQGRVVGQLIDAQGLHLQPVFEADFSEALAELTLRGLGVAWLPRRLCEPPLAEGRLVLAAPPALAARCEAHFEIRLYRRRSNANPQVEAVWRALRAASV
jgi:DNA-binding transcriptional LysR family regulator